MALDLIVPPLSLLLLMLILASVSAALVALLSRVTWAPAFVLSAGTLGVLGPTRVISSFCSALSMRSERQRPGNTRTLGEEGKVVLETSIEGIEAVSTARSTIRKNVSRTSSELRVWVDHSERTV